MNIDKKELKISICTQYDPSIMDRIQSRFPSLFVKVFTEEESFLKSLSDCDIVFLQKEISREISIRMESIITASKKLRWIHWGYTGLDRLKPLGSLSGRLMITNSKGVAADAIASYVITVILMLYREFPKLMRNQINKVWERWASQTVRGKTLGIIGLGSIGKGVARKAKVFQMRVIALVRKAVSFENVDSIFLPTELRRFLGESDIVVLSVPLTSETKGLIGEEALGWMKPGSYLVNVARGHIVDEEALVRALKRGQLAGASLDAFAQEPLLPESELWSLDNVIITPHLSGWTQDYPERVLDLFIENLERFMAGRDLINVVEMEKGY